MLDVFPALLSALQLKKGQVHVWYASLHRSESDGRKFDQILSLDEREKAARYHFDKDRRRFVACRGILRIILARYLNRDPADLLFAYGSNGKPRLADRRHHEYLQFNLSRSEDTSVYALTSEGEVGVDIEYLRDIPEIEHLAERAFSSRELAAYRSLPQEEKREAFFTGWTRKEAFAKAVGMGLLLPLDGLEVMFVQGKLVPPPCADERPIETAPWSIRDIKPGPDYAGAMAVRNRHIEILSRRWESAMN